MRKIKIFLILLVVSLPSFWVLIRPGYFPMHDDMQAMRLLQLDKCVRDFQIPCRWVPDMGYGYGYPQFNFYSPLPYYIMEIFVFAGFGFLASVKIGFILSVLVSAVGMYLLGRKLWGHWGGMISTLFYIYAPYRAVDMYIRGAVGEFWGMAFMPFIFWGLIKVVKKEKNAILYLALALSALFVSHNISSIMSAPFVGLWALYLLINDKGDSPILDKLKPIVVSFVWGLGLAAFFILPAWFEKKYVHVETITQGYFNYLAHFVSIPQLLFSNYWNYGVSEFGKYDDLPLQIGIFHWVLPLLALLLTKLLKRLRSNLTVFVLVSMGWMALFLTHSRSTTIWQAFTVMEYIQFPWRFLAIATFVFSASVGALGTLLTDPKKLLKMFVILFSILWLWYSSAFKPAYWFDINDTQKFSGDLWDRQQTISIFDYLPIFADAPPAERAPDEIFAVVGELTVSEKSLKSNSQLWKVEVQSEKAILRLPLYYFPGWEVRIDDVEVPITYDNELGLITFEVRNGNHTINANFSDTNIRLIGNILTVAAFGGILIYLRRK